MSMTKRDFIALADAMRRVLVERVSDTPEQAGIRYDVRQVLMAFCQNQNPAFNRERWLAYLRGECGPSGGNVARTRQGRRSHSARRADDLSTMRLP